MTPRLNDLTPADFERYQDALRERAAIMEYCANLPREEAERKAEIITKKQFGVTG